VNGATLKRKRRVGKPRGGEPYRATPCRPRRVAPHKFEQTNGCKTWIVQCFIFPAEGSRPHNPTPKNSEVMVGPAIFGVFRSWPLEVAEKQTPPPSWLGRQSPQPNSEKLRRCGGPHNFRSFSELGCGVCNPLDSGHHARLRRGANPMSQEDEELDEAGEAGRPA